MWLSFGAASGLICLQRGIRDPPESPLPLGASGVNVAPTSPSLWTLVYSGDQEQMSLKIGVWFMRSY